MKKKIGRYKIWVKDSFALQILWYITILGCILCKDRFTPMISSRHHRLTKGSSRKV